MVIPGQLDGPSDQPSMNENSGVLIATLGLNATSCGVVRIRTQAKKAAESPSICRIAVMLGMFIS